MLILINSQSSTAASGTLFCPKIVQLCKLEQTMIVFYKWKRQHLFIKTIANFSSNNQFMDIKAHQSKVNLITNEQGLFNPVVVGIFYPKQNENSIYLQMIIVLL